jgi:EmrB/QacA subfamily drug resistance transporter
VTVANPPRLALAGQGAPDHAYRWVATAVIGLGAVASFLSTTVVNVALPTLQHDLHTTLTAVQWTSSGYLLGLAGMIPITGWVSDRFGARRTYLGTLALFTIASLLCGFAHDIGSLIAFRVLQGMAGGMVMPIGMAILMRIFPPHQRGRMMAALGIPNMLAPALGPTLSGWVLLHSSWPYIFWINVPFCTLTLCCAALWLRDPGKHAAGRLDLVGALIGMPGVAILIYGITIASAEGWTSAAALGPIAGGLTLIASFVIWELRQQQPLLDLRMFRDAAFSASTLMSVVIAAGVFSMMVIVPLFMQQVNGYSSFDAGTAMSVQALTTALALPISGWATDRFGARPIVFFGTSMLAVSSFLMGTATISTGRTAWMLMLGLRGIGGAFCMMPVTSAAYVTIAPALLSRATAMLQTLQRLGMSFGTAIIASVAQARVAHAIHVAALPAVLGTQTGLKEAMWFAAGTGLLAIPGAALLRRPLPPGKEGEGHPPMPRPLRLIAVGLTTLALGGFALSALVTFAP